MPVEKDDSSEKTERPSEKQHQNFRKEGRIARSRDFSVALPLLSFWLLLYWASPLFSHTLASVFYDCLGINLMEYPEQDAVFYGIKVSYAYLIRLLLIIFLLLGTTTLCAAILPGGFLFQPELLTPRWERLNPVRGVKKILSRKGLSEVFKASIKIMAFSVFAMLFLIHHMTDIMNLGNKDINESGIDALQLLLSGCLYLITPILIMAIADLYWQRKKLHKELMQTRSQAKEALKDEEGSPQTRERIHRTRKHLSAAARKQMLDSVTDADFIVANPTHFAIALKYDKESQSAPLVLGKGVDFLAKQMIEQARKHGRFVFIQPQLARTLYYYSSVGEEIHPALYEAIAQVIVFLYQVHQYRSGESPRYPVKPRIHVPDMGGYPRATL